MTTPLLCFDCHQPIETHEELSIGLYVLKPRPFHMTDFENRAGDFSTGDWTNTRRSDLIGRLLGIISRRVRARFSCSILMRDWYAMQPSFTQMRQLPYPIAALSCATGVAKWVHRYGSARPVAYLFERGTMGEGALDEALKDICNKRLAEKYYIGSTTKGTKASPQLQAADLHTYEVRKHFLNELRERPRAQRRSFQRLLEIPEGGNRIITGAELREWDERVRTGGGGGVNSRNAPLNKQQTTRLLPGGKVS